MEGVFNLFLPQVRKKYFTEQIYTTFINETEPVEKFYTSESTDDSEFNWI